jgi:Prolipoprotein diacylglyceryl transferase
MYVFGFVGGYFLIRWLAKKRGIHLPKDVLQELISYLVVGVILGGRLGYVLFYNLPFYLANPLEICGLARRHVVSWRSDWNIIDGMVVRQETRLSVLSSG